MSAIQIATWVIIGLAWIANGFTIYYLRKSSRNLKRIKAANERIGRINTVISDERGVHLDGYAYDPEELRKVRKSWGKLR